jgi:hypothetical protein
MDIVYLWVNSQDPVHNKERNYWETQLCIRQKNELNRFQDHQELRFSLRSIVKYANWIRTIYIVIADNNQLPSWLNLENTTRIKIIRHSELFTKLYESHLPTFNSTAIECHLHRIPDLSEIFLYLNDDCFFGTNTFPWMFSKNDKAAIFCASGDLPCGVADSPGQDYSVCALGNSRTVIDTYLKLPNPPKLLLHQAKPLVKSAIDWAWKYPHISEKLIATSSLKFRAKTMLDPTTLFTYCGLFLNRAQYCPKMELYSQYVCLDFLDECSRKLQILLQKKPILFCLNDLFSQGKHLHQISELLQSSLNVYYPDICAWEIV